VCINWNGESIALFMMTFNFTHKYIYFMFIMENYIVCYQVLTLRRRIV